MNKMMATAQITSPILTKTIQVLKELDIDFKVNMSSKDLILLSPHAKDIKGNEKVKFSIVIPATKTIIETKDSLVNLDTLRQKKMYTRVTDFKIIEMKYDTHERIKGYLKANNFLPEPT